MTTWNQRFLSGHYPWDIGRASPVILRLFDEIALPPSNVIVVGCGQGWEVDALLNRGCNVTAFDISPAALKLIATRSVGRKDHPEVSLITGRLTLVCGDVLAVSDSLRGQYDCVVEHNCMCSICPDKWPEYVGSVAALLRPEGLLVGSFLQFDNTLDSGPPHGTHRQELIKLFELQFEIDRLTDAFEMFPPLDIELPPQVYRVAQLETVLRKRHGSSAQRL